MAKPMRGGGQSHRSAIGQPGRLRSSIVFQVFPESIGESGGGGPEWDTSIRFLVANVCPVVFSSSLARRIPGGLVHSGAATSRTNTKLQSKSHLLFGKYLARRREEGNVMG